MKKAVSSIFFIFLFTAFFAKPVSAHFPENQITIHINDDGFEPQSIEIEKGSIVTFENSGQNPHWPASNIHPTHSVYPGSDIQKCETDPQNIFDACLGINPQKTYSFKFDREGSWRYHDHLYPQLTGEVIVKNTQSGAKTEPDEDSQQKTSLLTSLKSAIFNLPSEFKIKITKLKYRIFPEILEAQLKQVDFSKIANNQDELEYWLKIAGPQKAMASLLETTGGGSQLDCHNQAHQIGRLSFKIYGAEAFEKGDASCHSGFYHGAMESFLSQNGTNNLAKNIEELCSTFETNFGNFECLHGVGHGVMAYEDYDLEKAISACNLLSTDYEQSSCYGGVFMENIVAGQGNGAIKGHETKWVNRKDPHFPCNSLKEPSENLLYQCYQMQTSWMLTIYNWDWDKTAKECQNASPENMKSVCFKSLGRDIAGATLRIPEKIVSLCNKVPQESDYPDQCVMGAVNVIVDFWGEKLQNQAADLCRLLDNNAKKTCYLTLSGRIPQIFTKREQQESICSTFEAEYQNLCIFPKS